jgi:uncharacterized protein YukE
MIGPSGEAFAPPPGWEKWIREAQEAQDRLLREIRARLAGLLGDPTLALSVAPQNLEDLRAASAALEHLGQRLEVFGAEAMAAFRAALGDGWLAARGFGMDPAAAWSRWLKGRAGEPLESLAAIFQVAGRFMAGVLARNGHPAEPPPSPALPAFALPQPAASPDGDLLEIRPEELRAAVGRMGQALREAEAALAGLQEALSRLETWEGYARLGFRDGVEAGRQALVAFLSEASRVMARIRLLPSEADRVAMALSAISPIPRGAIRLRSSHLADAFNLMEAIRQNALDLAGALTRHAAALREAWGDAAGAEAAVGLENAAALARAAVAQEAEALRGRVEEAGRAVDAYLAAVRALTDPSG